MRLSRVAGWLIGVLLLPVFGDINVTKTVIGYGYEFNTTLSHETIDATGVCVADNAADAYTYLVDNDYVLPSLPAPCENNRTEYSSSVPSGYVLADEVLISDTKAPGCDNPNPCRYDALVLDTKRFRVNPSNYNVSCRFGVQNKFYL